MEIKTTKDYAQLLHEKYPEISESDILKILNYGWKQFYLANSSGGDVCMHKPSGFWMYCGRLTKNSIDYFRQYVLKLVIKIRRRFARDKTPWDGYYYFALTVNQYQHYCDQQKQRGRPRKHFEYGNQYLYKLKEECILKNYNRRYIFKVPIGINFGWITYKPNYKTGDAELIDIIEPRKFKDILVTNNNYKT